MLDLIAFNSLLAVLSLQPLPAHSDVVARFLVEHEELYVFEDDSNGMDWMLRPLAGLERLGLVEWGWPEGFWSWEDDEMDDVENPRNRYRCVRPTWQLGEIYEAGRLEQLLEASR